MAPEHGSNDEGRTQCAVKWVLVAVLLLRAIRIFT